MRFGGFAVTAILATAGVWGIGQMGGDRDEGDGHPRVRPSPPIVAKADPDAVLRGDSGGVRRREIYIASSREILERAAAGPVPKLPGVTYDYRLVSGDLDLQALELELRMVPEAVETIVVVDIRG